MIELCAGTAAVSLAAIGAPPFPVSRIGSKTGYADAILEIMGLRRGEISKAWVFDKDRRMIYILQALFEDPVRLARQIENRQNSPPREQWELARRGNRPVDMLLYLAGARGGIGGFKGRHKHRPNVDGFIPSRASLASRVWDFSLIRGRRLEARVADVSRVSPFVYRPTIVYIDPPYLGRQSYGADLILGEPIEDIAQRWADAGHSVYVSEARPLRGAKTVVDLTHRRNGQARRSLTRDDSEFLSVF